MEKDFGSHLKAERKLRGVSLEDIAAQTCIPLRNLEALEDNRFDELPGEVFIRGFIRSCGQCLGIDPEELLIVYEESAGKTRAEEQRKQQAQKLLAAEKEEQARNRWKWVPPIGLGAAFLLWMAWGALTPEKKAEVSPPPEQKEAPGGETQVPPVETSGPAKDKTAPPTVPVEEAPAGPTDSGETETTTPPEETASASGPPAEEIPPESASHLSEMETKRENPVPESKKGVIIDDLQDQLVPSGPGTLDEQQDAPRPVSLEIQATERAWFFMVLDDTIEREFILKPGEKITLRANRRIRATIGNRGGTRMVLNGKEIEIPGTGNVIYAFNITAELIE